MGAVGAGGDPGGAGEQPLMSAQKRLGYEARLKQAVSAFWDG